MLTTDLHQLQLIDFTVPGKPEQRCRATFPLLGSHGTRDLATVYFELEPARELGTHTDSAEELLIILQGEVEVTVGHETGLLGAGQIAVVPKMARHNLRNVGDDTARILGVFGGANHIVATFDESWMPTGSNRVDTAMAG